MDLRELRLESQPRGCTGALEAPEQGGGGVVGAESSCCFTTVTFLLLQDDRQRPEKSMRGNKRRVRMEGPPTGRE